MDVEQERIAAILERTRAVLNAEEHATLTGIVDTVALIQAELQAKDASLERLRRMIFGASTESTRNVLGETARRARQPADPRAGGSGATADRKPPGHGRNAAAAYTGAEQMTREHPRSARRGGLSRLHERETVSAERAGEAWCASPAWHR